MKRFDVGDEVRIDIPDKSDPDHERLHGYIGKVVEILEDDASTVTGDERDDQLFRVQLGEGCEQVDVRWRDLRPP